MVKDVFQACIFEGEPVVLGFESGNEVIIIGCSVIKIDPLNRLLVVKQDSIITCENKRRCKRYPLSLYGDVISENSRKKHIVIIKDLSESGIRIFSKESFTIGQNIELNIYAESSMIFLKCTITRVLQNTFFFEYGLQIKYESVSSINQIKQYINKLALMHERYLNKLKNSR